MVLSIKYLDGESRILSASLASCADTELGQNGMIHYTLSNEDIKVRNILVMRLLPTGSQVYSPVASLFGVSRFFFLPDIDENKQTNKTKHSHCSEEVEKSERLQGQR